MIKKNDIKKSEKNSENPLVSFMKAKVKQNQEDWASKALQKKNGKSAADSLQEGDSTNEQEQLEEAKQESEAKAAKYNRYLMFARLAAQTFMRYAFMIALLIAVAFLFIKSIPLIMAFFHGLISKVIFGAIK